MGNRNTIVRSFGSCCSVARLVVSFVVNVMLFWLLLLLFVAWVFRVQDIWEYIVRIRRWGIPLSLSSSFSLLLAMLFSFALLLVLLLFKCMTFLHTNCRTVSWSGSSSVVLSVSYFRNKAVTTVAPPATTGKLEALYNKERDIYGEWESAPHTERETLGLLRENVNAKNESERTNNDVAHSFVLCFCSKSNNPFSLWHKNEINPEILGPVSICTFSHHVCHRFVWTSFSCSSVVEMKNNNQQQK